MIVEPCLCFNFIRTIHISALINLNKKRLTREPCLAQSISLDYKHNSIYKRLHFSGKVQYQ